MKKILVSCSSALVALSVSLQVQASGGTWSLPYGGVCDIATTCFAMQNNRSGDAPPFSSPAMPSAIYAYGAKTALIADGNDLGVSATGNNTGVRTVGGVNGVDTFGWGYGLVAAGGAAGIYLNATIPANGQNPLCKSTSGSTAGTVGYCSSTRAMKEEIRDLDLGMETLAQLRPVMFRWRADHTPDIGFIADEVARVNPVLAVYNEEGKLQSVKYTQLTALLTKAFQEQVRERNTVEEDLRKQLQHIARRNADLETQLHDQQKVINSLAARLAAVEERAGRVQ